MEGLRLLDEANRNEERILCLSLESDSIDA